MKTATQWFSEYGESHQNKTNKLIHWFAVPLIFWSVALMMWSIPQMAWMEPYHWLNWTTLMLILIMVFYATMSLSILIGMFLFSVLVVWLTEWVIGITGIAGWQLGLAIFVVAWIFQFIGHHIEGKKPSFFKDLLFLLVGPAWLLGFVYKKLGVKYS